MGPLPAEPPGAEALPGVLPGADLDDDGIGDPTESDPEEGPGEVKIDVSSLGGGQGGYIILRGRDPGDQFGEDVAILNDVNDNGYLDLIVGAPNAGANSGGEAYIFFGPFSPGTFAADQADLILSSGLQEDIGFGWRVAPLFDVTRNGLQEIRVGSRWHDGHHWRDLMHVYDGEANHLFTVASTEEFDPWISLPGDINGDGIVDRHDLDLISETAAGKQTTC